MCVMWVCVAEGQSGVVCGWVYIVQVCLVWEICLCVVGLGFGECFEAGLILLGLLVEQVSSGFCCVSERWLCAFLPRHDAVDYQ